MLIFARDRGSAVIRRGRPCAGVQLGLGANQIQVVWHGWSGATGRRLIETTAPGPACGGHLQLLDLRSCTTSNVARIE